MVDHNAKQGPAFPVACCTFPVACCTFIVDDCHPVLHVAIGQNHPVHKILPGPVKVICINYR
jgi:hypothetical protein